MSTLIRCDECGKPYSGFAYRPPATCRRCRVRSAAANLERDRRELQVAILSAREHGVSLRDLSAMTGLSHETVRRIASQ